MAEGTHQYKDIKIGGKDESPGGMFVLNPSNKVIEWRARDGSKHHKVVSGDVKKATWFRVGKLFQVCFDLLASEIPLRFEGFRGSDYQPISAFLKDVFGVTLTQVTRSACGKNFGALDVDGSTLTFSVGGQITFDVLLQDVCQSQVVEGKNEISLELHQDDTQGRNDESLLEMRFYIPPVEVGEDDTDVVQPVDELHEKIIAKAKVHTFAGEKITTISEVGTLVPRGRHDIEIYSSFFKLHGKSADFKIMYTHIKSLYLLPQTIPSSTETHCMRDFVISLDPPIRKGQTTYPFIVMVLNDDEEVSVTFDVSENDLKDKYNILVTESSDDASPKLSGPLYEVLNSIFKGMVGKRVIREGEFRSSKGNACVKSSIGANNGHLFLLNKSLFFLEKPPTHVRYDEIEDVTFERAQQHFDSVSSSFDVKFRTKSQTNITFNNIPRPEYNNFFGWLQKKEIKIKNIDAARPSEGRRSMAEDSDGDVPMRRGGDDDDSESEDDDFDPTKVKGGGDEPDEEFDSGSDDSDESGSSSGDDSSDSSDSEDGKKKKKRAKSGGKSSRSPAKKKKKTKGPKRGLTAFMCFSTKNREKVKEANPDASFGELGKLLGAAWKELTDEEKEEYVKMSEADAKEKADAYEAAGGAAAESSDSDDGGRKRKKTAKLGPKRGLTAFMCFSTKNREKVKEANPDASFGELGKLLGAAWKELTDEEKEEYVKMSAADAKEKADAYEAAGGDEAAKAAMKAAGVKASPAKKAKKAPVQSKMAKIKSAKGGDSDSSDSEGVAISDSDGE